MRSTTSAPPNKRLPPPTPDLDHQLQRIYQKIQRGAELHLQVQADKALKASQMTGKRVESEEKRREREEEAFKRTLALKKDIDKHAVIREETRLEEVKKIERKNELAREKTEREKIRQVRENMEKEAKMREKEQQREESLSRQSFQKMQHLAARSREFEQRFQAHKERYQLVQALKLQRNKTLLVELAEVGRNVRDVSMEKEVESFRRASEAERKRIEQRTKARADAIYRQLALNSGPTL